ncbi:MAG: response regulator transcription factor, partial [Rhodobacteraceae bacterium]|nr:response regulator transcription factor [Paracoccaceae bacterium]
MTAPLVMILDDEPAIRALLAETLTEAGYRTQTFGRASDFETALKRATPDLCLVDLGLPDRDGLSLVHRLALELGATVVIISGRAQVQDRVTGLELGADDYITKPFDPAEVLARVRARLRGRTVPETNGNTAHFSGWTAHFDRYALEDETGTETPFSHAEGEVLKLFLEAPNRLITRAYMQETLGGAAGDSFDRAMDVRI